MALDIELYEPEEDILSNLYEQETVWLDRGCCNEQLVTIISFDKKRCTVKDKHNQLFTVLVMRLTKP